MPCEIFPIPIENIIHSLGIRAACLFVIRYLFV